MLRGLWITLVFFVLGCGPSSQPPTPPPTPPTPDALTGAIAYAYTLDTTKEKLANIKALAAVYRNAGQICDNQKLSTLGELQNALHAAAVALIPDDALVGLRRDVLANVWKQEMGTIDDPLTPALRAKAKALCARIATALEGIH